MKVYDMNKIIVMRHAESEGNLKRIIQGITADFGITLCGAKQCESLAKELESQLVTCTHIISSTTKRAYQTAEMIKKTAGLPCIIQKNSLLEEMNAGILAGHTHQEAKALYPQEYDIWIKRMDLDGIKEAEKGNHLQARVLAFLIQYFQNEEYSDLIVSHAGFIRSLINTVNASKRETQIHIPNCACFVLYDVWRYIKYDVIKEKTHCLILHVKTADAQYIIKRYTRSLDNFELELDKIQNRVHAIKNYIPEVFFSGNVISREGKQYGIRIYTYLEGTHKYGELGCEKVQIITKKIEGLLQEYNQYHIIKCSAKHNLFYNFENIVFDNMSSKLILLKNMILQAPEYHSLKNQKEQILTLYDVHRENILFDGDKILFIDMGSVILAPEVFQAAVVIIVTFMLYSIKDGISCIEYYLKEKKYNPKELKICMLLRIFLGVSYFENRQINNKNQYLDMYWNAYEYINKLFVSTE